MTQPIKRSGDEPSAVPTETHATDDDGRSQVPTGGEAAAEEWLDKVRDEARTKITDVARQRWYFLAMLGGISHRGGGAPWYRLVIILGFGFLFAVMVYALLALTLLGQLNTSITAAGGKANAEYAQVLAKMMTTGFSKDVKGLARVYFTTENGRLEATIWTLPKSVVLAEPELEAKSLLRTKPTFAEPSPDEKIYRGPVVEIKPILVPLYEIDSRLSPQALVKILVASSAARRQALDKDFPSEQAVEEYGRLLREGVSPTGDETDVASVEGYLTKVARGSLFTWSRRLSGIIQFWIVGLFGAFLLSLWIRSQIDYGFDRWLQSEKSISDFFNLGQLDKDAQGNWDPRLLEGFHKFNEGILQLQKSSSAENCFLDSVTFHLRREAIAAVCQGGHDKIEAVRSLLDSSVRAFSDRYYTGTSVPRFLLWSLPTAGFVGTTWGIGGALGNANLLQSVDLATREAGRSIVSTSISVAFDTTFLGLVLSMVGMLMLHLIQERQELYVHEVASEVNAAMTNANFFGASIPLELDRRQYGVGGAVSRGTIEKPKGRFFRWFILLMTTLVGLGIVYGANPPGWLRELIGTLRKMFVQ